MAQQVAEWTYAGTAVQGRVRRASMELNPASAAFLQQDGINGMNYSTSSYKQDPLSLLLGQDVAAAASGAGLNGINSINGLLPINGLPAMTGGMVEQPHFTEPQRMPGTSCYSSMPMDAEEPGPLPCLPRSGRMAGGYGSNTALLMQQQQLQHLQRCGYSNSGAPGPGGRPFRPRRHSVTIGMLNEHQQQQALLAAGGQLPAGWSGGLSGAAAAVRAGPSRMQMLPQQSSPNKQLQALNIQAAAAAAQLGLSQTALGQPFMAGPPSAGAGIQQLQQLSGTPTPPASSLAGAVGLGSAGPGGPLGLDLTPGHGVDGPRMPGASGSRRHSWAPMGADASMAYARSWLLQQQQQLRGLSAQLGDAGAVFVNQQQQDQLGLGRLGAPLGQHNGLDSTAAGLNGRTAALMGDSAGSGLHSQAAFNLSIGQPGSMYGADALAKDQVAQHLQHQLQQLQLQDLASRIGGAGQGLDPYAEPFVSQAVSLMQPGGGLAGLAGIDPYTTVLHQELQQQQQSALALHLVEDAGLSPAAAAAASMYAPLQVNGVSVDTQLLVSPYVDNWDVLAQSSANSSLSGSNSAVSSSSGVSALACLGTTPMSHVGLPAKAAKGVPFGGLCGGSGGLGSSRVHHSHILGSNSSSTSTPACSGNGSKGSSTAPAAAAAAAATMLASLPPLTKVCSDVPWNLKKAADEDAKVMTAQQDQVKKLAAALERSKTLQQVHAVEHAVVKASAAAASSMGQQTSAGAADGAAALFGYKLPDSGSDTWGGSSGGGDSVAVPGDACISQEPSNKLFVGNIGWWVTEEDLLHWFSRFGNVLNVKIMYNSRKMHKPKDKWRSREYGFIDYGSPEEAAKAIVWMDGVELPDLMKDTCGIIVQYAKPTGGNEASGSAA